MFRFTPKRTATAKMRAKRKTSERVYMTTLPAIACPSYGSPGGVRKMVSHYYHPVSSLHTLKIVDLFLLLLYMSTVFEILQSIKSI